MLRIAREILTKNKNNNNCKSDSRVYALIVVDQLSQIRHSGGCK